MNRFRALLLSIVAVSLLSACARLDNDLFEPEKVSSYRFDDYPGEVEFQVDIDINNAWLNQIDLESTDGSSRATIKAVYLGELLDKGTDQEAIPADTTVILFAHGNHAHMDYYWPRTKLLAFSGGYHNFGVLTLDYRGYGASSGEPSESGLYADVDAAIRWLESRGVTSDRFIMYGFSLGTAPAVELTANPRSALIPAKLILEAPFASAEVMLQDATGLALPGSYVTDVEIDNADKIRRVSQPLLWIHGEKDKKLQIDTHGAVVYRNHPGVAGVDKLAVRVPGADHSDIPVKYGLLPNYASYQNLIYSFIAAGTVN